MTEQEMLETEKYWCENCCNWDKEQVRMDGYAKCKLTGTLCFAQESGKECRCFNVPAENVIAPPCRVGQTVYVGNLHTAISEIIVGKEINFMCYFDCECVMENVGCGDCPFAEWHETYEGDIDCQTYGCFSFTEKDIGKTVFLTKEEAEEALKGGVQG